MLGEYKSSTLNQFEAALRMMHSCVERCPDSIWNAPVANLKYCQVAFHAIFFTDYYLGRDADPLADDPFHREHADYFRDYEELQDRAQQYLYDRPTTLLYVGHCRAKAAASIGGETEATLLGPSGFPGRDFHRAELHIYSLRHLEHHIGQLSVRLRQETGDGAPWVMGGSER
ncbi:MAG: hypothetical protein QGG36_25755 [Pirellulaceae bacterium]|jgi:hypothetical protein|nr:hypothetical protein [Pirellulaceae bacterium]MDP7019229.1 hypothetical protein [Pirellulaceae bacterium]